MRVEFSFKEGPIDVSYQDTDVDKVNRTIRKKVEKKVIEIPCIPTKEMVVDILSFSEVFGFSEKEKECIDDCGAILYISGIIIKPSHLELWLGYRI